MRTINILVTVLLCLVFTSFTQAQALEVKVSLKYKNLTVEEIKKTKPTCFQGRVVIKKIKNFNQKNNEDDKYPCNSIAMSCFYIFYSGAGLGSKGFFKIQESDC